MSRMPGLGSGAVLPVLAVIGSAFAERHGIRAEPGKAVERATELLAEPLEAGIVGGDKAVDLDQRAGDLFALAQRQQGAVEAEPGEQAADAAAADVAGVLGGEQGAVAAGRQRRRMADRQRLSVIGAGVAARPERQPGNDPRHLFV